MNTNFKFYLLTCAICILLFITILAPYIVPFDPYEQNLASTLQAPNTYTYSVQINMVAIFFLAS